MHFNKNKKAEIVRFAFMIYMLVLGVAFGLFLFKGYTLVVESEAVELRQQLQIAVFVAESVFSLGGESVTMDSSILMQEDVTSVELKENTVVAYIGGTPLFRSFSQYPDSQVTVGSKNSSTLHITGSNNILYFGEKPNTCETFRPPITIVQNDNYDNQLFNLAKAKSLVFSVKSVTDTFIDEIQIVLDLDASNTGLTIYSNQDATQLCTLTQSLDTYDVDYAVLPITEYEFIRYPLLQEKMTYIVGGENQAQLVLALEDLKK